MEEQSQVIFDKNVVEFVTVSAEYCAFIEQNEMADVQEYVSTLLKILPLVYLKALLLPDGERMGFEDPEIHVDEITYERIQLNIAKILGPDDDYLEVFVPDMAYSDQPIKQWISEGLADIYQDLKNFVFVFQLGLNETMNDALVICKENFEYYWGQRLVNTLRALHNVKYSSYSEDADPDFW